MGFFHTIFLSDGFRSVRPLPFGNLTLGFQAIIKSRLCREAAKVGGGLWPLVGVKGRTDSHASDVGHWLGMTPLRGVRGGQGRPPLRTVTRGAAVKWRAGYPKGTRSASLHSVEPRPYTPNIEPHNSAFRSKSGSGKRSSDDATFR